MDNVFIPLVHDAIDSLHKPASNGTFLDPKFVPVKIDATNLIKVDDEGLYATRPLIVSEDAGNFLREGRDFGALLKPSDMVSGDLGNALRVGGDGGLYIQTQSVSRDAGNAIRLGSDLGAYLRSSDIVSGDVGNELGVGDDGGLFIKTQFVSYDEGNFIRRGSDLGAFVDGNDILSNEAKNLLGISSVDGKIMLSEQALEDVGVGQPEKFVQAGDKLLYVTGDGKLASDLSIGYDVMSGRFDLIGPGNRVITSVVVPSSTSAMKNATLEVNPPTQAPGTYLHFVLLLADNTTTDLFVNVTSLVDTYIGGIGVEVKDYVVNLKIQDGGGLCVNDRNEVGVDFEGLISSDIGNRLTVSRNDNKLLVEPSVLKAGQGTSILQGDTVAVRVADHQGLTFDGAGNLMAMFDDFVSTAPGNGLSVDPSGKLFAKGTGGISKDRGNGLTVGTDDMAYFPSDLGTM